jgi:hypothetical protein
MALEINEIGIRMRVYGERNEEPPAVTGDEPGLNARERDEVVEVCVRRVLRLLRAMEER